MLAVVYSGEHRKPGLGLAAAGECWEAQAYPHVDALKEHQAGVLWSCVTESAPPALRLRVQPVSKAAELLCSSDCWEAVRRRQYKRLAKTNKLEGAAADSGRTNATRTWFYSHGPLMPSDGGELVALIGIAIS